MAAVDLQHFERESKREIHMITPPESPYRDQFRPWEPGVEYENRVFSTTEKFDGLVRGWTFELKSARSLRAALDTNKIIALMMR